jgi:hypothetical protein
VFLEGSFATASVLEGDGFESSIPREEEPIPRDGTVKLSNHSEKFAAIDVQMPSQSLPRPQPFLVPKT